MKYVIHSASKDIFDSPESEATRTEFSESISIQNKINLIIVKRTNPASTYQNLTKGSKIGEDNEIVRFIPKAK